MNALRGLAWLLGCSWPANCWRAPFSLPLPGPVLGMLLLVPALLAPALAVAGR
jgi:putative effector of murein hydrolase LrgA (UPF0299 family)